MGSQEDLTEIARKVSDQRIKPSVVDENHSWLTYIASGEGRSVFSIESTDSFGNAVVKFAKNKTDRRGGIDQNQYESFLWEKATSEERSFLAPVLESHNRGLWLIMRYADPVPEDHNLEPVRDELYELFGNRIDSTFRRRNFGYINGDVKLVDYGYSMKI